jgi:hypothetical protein
MLNFRKRLLALYAVIWILVFLTPYIKTLGTVDSDRWVRMLGDWINLALLFFVFLINLQVLVPKLLFKNKRTQYALVVLALIVVIAGIDIALHQGSVPPPPSGPHPPRLFVFHSLLGALFTNFITAILIIGSSTAFELEYKWMMEKTMRKDLEKEQLKTNLALLRNQVSPHFFMNTLNNIHSLIEMDVVKAQDAVERLSTLMRYLLYDSTQNTIELRKEVEFVQSYIGLMQLRHSDEVAITLEIPDQLPDIRIPPMLLISLLENAFKHGVQYPLKSYIYFSLLTTENALHCTIKNSKHKKTSPQPDDYSGIGLSNLKESLRLLYDDAFSLDIADTENDFEVLLSIPL